MSNICFQFYLLEFPFVGVEVIAFSNPFCHFKASLLLPCLTFIFSSFRSLFVCNRSRFLEQYNRIGWWCRGVLLFHVHGLLTVDTPYHRDAFVTVTHSEALAAAPTVTGPYLSWYCPLCRPCQPLQYSIEYCLSIPSHSPRLTILSTVRIIFPFPECSRFGTVHHITFPDWLLPLSVIYIMFISPFSFKKNTKDGWWDGSVGRCLPQKCEDLELNPDVYLKSLAWWYVSVSPVLGSSETGEDPTSCRSANSAGCSEGWEWETLPQKIRWTVMGETPKADPWSPKKFTASTWIYAICTDMYRGMCRHMYRRQKERRNHGLYFIGGMR